MTSKVPRMRRKNKTGVRNDSGDFYLSHYDRGGRLQWPERDGFDEPPGLPPICPSMGVGMRTPHSPIPTLCGIKVSLSMLLYKRPVCDQSTKLRVGHHAAKGSNGRLFPRV